MANPGVGKGFLARTIHQLSGRTGDFVVLNCEGVSADQIETALFGCENGSSIEATDTKVGLIEAAKGGTVFLEEIGRMPLHVQTRLLRTVEHRAVVPVAATRPRPVDARFISSPSQDLEAACSDGRFRVDLFFRLSGVTLEIPPLRQRTEEIPRLVDTFINDFRRDSRRQPSTAGQARRRRVIKDLRCESDRPRSLRVPPDAMDLLFRYAWPGNIGELKKVIGRALVLCDGSGITPSDLTVEIRAASEGLVAGQIDADAKLSEAVRDNAATRFESDGEEALQIQSPEETAEKQRILDSLEGRATSRMRRRGSS